jgi:hypothetical protein
VKNKLTTRGVSSFWSRLGAALHQGPSAGRAGNEAGSAAQDRAAAVAQDALRAAARGLSIGDFGCSLV